MTLKLEYGDLVKCIHPHFGSFSGAVVGIADKSDEYYIRPKHIRLNHKKYPDGVISIHISFLILTPF